MTDIYPSKCVQTHANYLMMGIYMLLWLTVLAAGVCLLLVSTNSLISAARFLAFSWRISPLVVGTLIVGLITNLPELTVSLTATLQGDTQLAIGNVIGSNIVNVLLALPAGILAGKLRVGTTKTQKSIRLLLVITILFVILVISGLPPLTIGITLLVLTAGYICLELFWAIIGRNEEDKKTIKNFPKYHHPSSLAAKIIASVTGITLGGIIVVQSVENLAVITGLSTGFLGLTLASTATSLPEIFTSIFSQENHQAKVTLGNIIGSNFYNLLLIAGLAYLLSRPVTPHNIEIIWLIGSTFMLAFLAHHFQGKGIPKYLGLLLLGLSLLYFITLYLMS